ncbi:MAG: hypothetical protein ACP5VQ_03670 [Phycisphaerae bacterium]
MRWRNAQHARRQGFNLFEVIAALPLMAVFFLMAGQLFVLCLHTFNNADLRATHLCQRQQLIRELRQDVATAQDVRVQESHGLICRFGKKWEILWLANANGTVTRMCQNGHKSPRPQYWPALLSHLHFALLPNGYVNICWLHGKQRVAQTLDSPMALADSGKAGRP